VQIYRLKKTLNKRVVVPRFASGRALKIPVVTVMAIASMIFLIGFTLRSAVILWGAFGEEPWWAVVVMALYLVVMPGVFAMGTLPLFIRSMIQRLRDARANTPAEVI
jgi:hypothetical protein